MKYRLIDSNGKARWNQFVLNSPRSHIFQSYEWGEVMSHSGWQPLRLVVEDGNHIIACISILMKKMPLTPWSIFYSPRGPIINFEDQRTFRYLTQAICEIAATQKAIFLQLVPHAVAEDFGVAEALDKEKFIKIEKQGLLRLTEPLWVYRIDLSKTEEQLMAQMKRKTRYSVRLGLRYNVEVTQSSSFNDLIAFYNLLKNTSKRKKFPIRNFSYFKSIWEQMAPDGIANLFFATYKGEILSGALIILFGGLCWYMYGASDNKNREVMPNYALQWHIAKWAKAKGCRWYDLRGVPFFNPPSTHGGFGVYLFKRGFGGAPFTFLGDYYYIFRQNMYKTWELGETLLNQGAKMMLKFFYG